MNTFDKFALSSERQAQLADIVSFFEILIEEDRRQSLIQ